MIEHRRTPGRSPTQATTKQDERPSAVLVDGANRGAPLTTAPDPDWSSDPALRRLTLPLWARWGLLLIPAIAVPVWLAGAIAELAASAPWAWAAVGISYVGSWLLSVALLFAAVRNGDLEQYDYPLTIAPLTVAMVGGQFLLARAFVSAAATQHSSPRLVSPAARKAVLNFLLATGFTGAVFAAIGAAILAAIIYACGDLWRSRFVAGEPGPVAGRAALQAASLFEQSGRHGNTALVHLLQRAARATRVGVWNEASKQSPRVRRDFRLLARPICDWLEGMEAVSADSRERQRAAASALREHAPALIDYRWLELARAVGQVSPDELAVLAKARRRVRTVYAVAAIALAIWAIVLARLPDDMLPPTAPSRVVLWWSWTAAVVGLLLYVLQHEGIVDSRGYHFLRHLASTMFGWLGISAPSHAGATAAAVPKNSDEGTSNHDR